MIRKLMSAAVLATAAFVAQGAAAQAVVGQPAPAFTGTDLSGKRVSLADFKGRYVVMEWNNPGCPFVVKHYMTGNMQGLQKRFMAENVAWIAVNSTAPGSTDYLKNDALAAWFKQQDSAPTAVLADPDGRIGKAFAARVTPHMYVIDPQGKVVYAGAIDDKRSTNPADVKTATNYVARALTELRAGKAVSTANTPAYGCTIKYSD